MARPIVVRPREFMGSERARVLTAYLKEQWQRAEVARSEQVDTKYTKWQSNYDGIPAQKERVLPWVGASNYVVPLTRMFIDTFMARTLNIVFATRPLYILDFIQNSDIRKSTEYYLNKKALAEWRHYDLTRGMLVRGPKNGTVVAKTVWREDSEIEVVGSEDGASYTETDVLTYSGPDTEIVPFEDIYVHPITVNRLEDAQIIFHRVRLQEEEAVRRASENGWPMTEDEIRGNCLMPVDVKRQKEQEEAGISDSYLRELHLIECHLKYDLQQNGRYYRIIALLHPTTEQLFDLYFLPYPKNMKMWRDYRPAPKEDFFYGESWCQILAQSQEEACQIHNDRRNASYILNAPIFKKKQGSLLPNPSTTWYPGKVWNLESMDDFEVVALGGSYNDMLNEENHIVMMAERLVGIGAVQQGNAAGFMGKRGIYNAAGTLAVLSESNQRQDTNIRDIRQVLSDIAKQSFMLQREYGADDPLIDMLARDNPKMGDEIRAGLEMATPDLLSRNYFEIKASDAGANSEVAKANVLQMAQVIGSYGSNVPAMAMQLSTMKDPTMRMVLEETIKMQKWMATQVLRAFGEFDAEQQLPDILRAFSAGATQAATQGMPTPNVPGAVGGGGQSINGSDFQRFMASIGEVPTAPA